MKRYITLTFLILSFIITGCGKKDDIVCLELANSFYESSLFEERLEEIDSSAAETRYGFNNRDYSEIAAFIGTKAVCDEFLIVKTTDTEKIKSAINKYLDDKIKDYELYRPDEVYKLTKPLMLEYNGTVVVVICHDTNAAEKVYKEYLKS